MSIFDLKIGFYTKNHPYSQFPRSKIARLDANMRNFTELYQFHMFLEVDIGLGLFDAIIGKLENYLGGG